MPIENISDIYVRTFKAVRIAYLAYVANPNDPVLKKEWMTAYRACSKAQKDFYLEQKGNADFIEEKNENDPNCIWAATCKFSCSCDKCLVRPLKKAD